MHEHHLGDSLARGFSALKRPAKRRKLRSAPTNEALAPLLNHNSEAGLRQPHSLTPPSATQLEVDICSPRPIAEVRQLPWTIRNTIFHKRLEVPRLRQSRCQLRSIKSGPSKVSSNAQRSGMRQRIISSSSCHVSRITSVSNPFRGVSHWF
jgi:hypothetical protein